MELRAPHQRPLTPKSLTAAASWAARQGRTPLVSLLQVGAWQVAIWQEGSEPGTAPDLGVARIVSTPKGMVLRLVVADPAENALLSDARRHSARAVAAVWDAARFEPSPEAALAVASTQVCDPSLRPRLRNPLATAAVADLHLVEPLILGAARAADCEVWVSGGSGFSELLAGDMFTEVGRARFVEERSKVGSGPERWAAQETAVDEPDLWTTHPVGMVREPQVQRCGRTERVRDLILSTDGARLDAGTAVSVTDWLAEGIADVPSDWPHQRPFGDLSVIWAQHQS